MAQGRRSPKAAAPKGGSWNLSRFQMAPAQGVTIFEALNIHKGTVQWPPFAARLPAAVNAAQKASVAAVGQGGGGGGGGGKGGKGGKGSGGHVAHPGSLQAAAMALLKKHGWGGQFAALNNIIMHESGWRVNAANPSGAFGIPQALPGSKMAAAGRDWRTNGVTQLRWMIDMYIPSRYGTPDNAWRFWQANGWY